MLIYEKCPRHSDIMPKTWTAAVGEPLGIKVIRPYSDKVNFIQALRLAGSEIIINNRTADIILSDSDLRENHQNLFPIFTGTLVAYKGGNGIPLGNTIRSNRFVIQVPQEYRNERDCLIYVEHPNFTLEDNKGTMTVKSNSIKVIREFPPRNGWYNVDEETGIPTGTVTSSASFSVRQLLRSNADYVGPLVRYNGNLTSERTVSADRSHNDKFGVGSVLHMPALPKTDTLEVVNWGPNAVRIATSGVTKEQLMALYTRAKGEAEALERIFGSVGISHIKALLEAIRKKN
jgi:hypothetical protein